jgi:hypothetical protein
LTNFKVGVRPDLLGYFKGTIDDVGVWNCALPLGDIEDPNPGTINYVRLNGISGPGYGTASNPNPSNMQTNVNVNADLRWRAGEYAADVNGHRLYFGKNFNDVNAGTADCVILTEPNYSPANLDYGTVYYWRVDEVNDPCAWQGRVWEFTTNFGIVDPNLISNWRFDKGSGLVAYDSIGHSNGVIYGATWTTDGQFGNALSFDGNDYVDIGNIGITGDWTVCFWAKSSENTWTTYYPIGLQSPYTGIRMGGVHPTVRQHITLYTTTTQLFSITTVEPGIWYHIAVTKNEDNYSIYINGEHEKTCELNDIDLTNFKVGVRPDSLGYFKGTIDDVGVWNCALPLGDIEDPNPGTINYVRLNGISGPYYGIAWNPRPFNEQSGVPNDIILVWRPGDCMADMNGHNVYFGTDFNDVNKGTINYVTVSEPSYHLDNLDYNTTYYWRVDEVNDPCVWQGNVWSFTTRPLSASEPYPTNNAEQVFPHLELDWIPGGHVADVNGHDVYFGTSRSDVEMGCRELFYDIDDDNQVNFADLRILCEQWLEYVEGMNPKADLNGDKTVNLIDFAIMAEEWKGSIVYKGRQTANWYDPCNLKFGTTYFWRVDEYNEPNVWPGEAWSFTVGIDEPALTNAPTYQVTPTYDGSGQGMHPDVVYFPDGWNGYRYWMAMTPFTCGDFRKENPSILASNDGSSWEVPPGLTNPIISTPSGDGYNADPDIVYNDDTNELWVYFFRCFYNTNLVKLTLMRSSDGIHWSAPEYLITWDPYPYDEGSFAVIKQGSDWHYWAWSSIAPHKVRYRHSEDGKNWSEGQNVTFSPEPLMFPWHLNVIYVPTKLEYWMLFCDSSGAGGRLVFAKSTDRLNWTPSSAEVLSPSAYGWDNYTLYRATLLYDSTSQLLKVWYSARNTLNQWHTGYVETNY